MQETESSKVQLSEEGRRLFRRFRFFYIGLRTFIYGFIWTELVGGFEDERNVTYLLLPFILMLASFVLMRVLSDMVFSTPKEKLSMFLLRISFFTTFGLAFYQSGRSTFILGMIESLSAGLLIFGVGSFLWWRARSDLQPYYYDVVYISDGQQLQDLGLYGHLRHPGYLGEWLCWCGGAVLINNIWALLVVPLVSALALSYRVRQEEHLLKKELSGYDHYCQSVKRLKWI